MEIRIFDIDSHSESELKLCDAVKHYKSTLEALWTLAHQNKDKSSDKDEQCKSHLFVLIQRFGCDQCTTASVIGVLKTRLLRRLI